MILSIPYSLFSFAQEDVLSDIVIGGTSVINQDNPVINLLDPTIQFQFKYPITNLDKNQVHIKTGEEAFPLDPGNDITLLTNAQGQQTILQIKINDNPNLGNVPLRKNTSYQIEIEAGALQLNSGSLITNDEITKSFVTGGTGANPQANAYSSSEAFTDDIRNKSQTGLAADGAIHIKFDREIKIEEGQNLIDNTTLYRMLVPKITLDAPNGEFLYEKAVDNTVAGVVYGEVYVHKDDYKEAVELQSVEIVGTQKNIVKVKSKNPLAYLNQYQLSIDNQEIEDIYGYNAKEDVSFYFWTKVSSSTTTPSWTGLSGSLVSGEYYCNLNYGVEKYSPTNPIELNISGAVIPSSKNSALEGSYYKNRGLENIILSPLYDDGQVYVVGSETEDIDLFLGEDFQLTLSEAISPIGQAVTWQSKDAAIVKVDQDGNLEGLKKGTTQVYALASDDSSILTTVTVHVLEGALKIEKFEIIYNANALDTKLLLYPSQLLDSGRAYRLVIPAETFETRGSTYLPKLTMDFVTGGDSSGDIRIESLGNNTTNVGSLMGSTEFIFWIYGYNFHEKIKSIELLREDGTHPITIDPKYIYFENVDKIKVTLKDPLKASVAKEDYAGKYTLAINFENPNNPSETVSVAAPANLYFEILTLGKPVVTATSPSTSGTVDEKSLTRLQVVFNDPDGKLGIYNTTTGLTNMMDSIVKALGSSASMIDTDAINEILNMNEIDRESYIASNILVKNTTNKTATLYVPLKPLRSQTTYYVTLRPGIVTNDAGTNDEITWSFQTRSVPTVHEISIGSVVEDYDEDEPIILKGDFFENTSISVYFNDIEADRVDVEEVEDESGNVIEKILKVYLPEGSNKLPAGTYNIKVVNDSDHSTIEYGAFSVIKKGENAPNSDYLVKGKEREGEIRGNLKVSEDTLHLSSRYTDDAFVTLELDDLMEQDVYLRKIQFDGHKSDKIGILETKSKWSDVTLYGVTLDNHSESDEITITVGRVEPTVAQSLGKKLGSKAVKSQYIQVSGENYLITGLQLRIPFSNSSGKNLKVLRYDEATRNFYEVKAAVNLVDGIVNVTSQDKGIFVVVEE